MHVKRSRLEYYFVFFHTNRSKIFFPNISRLENDETFQDSVGTLSSRPVGHNFSILDAGQSSSELARKKLSAKKALSVH